MAFSLSPSDSSIGTHFPFPLLNLFPLLVLFLARSFLSSLSPLSFSLLYISSLSSDCALFSVYSSALLSIFHFLILFPTSVYPASPAVRRPNLATTLLPRWPLTITAIVRRRIRVTNRHGRDDFRWATGSGTHPPSFVLLTVNLYGGSAVSSVTLAPQHMEAAASRGSSVSVTSRSSGLIQVRRISSWILCCNNLSALEFA